MSLSANKGRLIQSYMQLMCYAAPSLTSSRQCQLSEVVCALLQPVFMAPEVYARNYGKPADLWSCGIMMYQLVAKRFPFW